MKNDDRLGIRTLEERRNRADLLQVFKLYKGWSSTPFGHFFTASTVTNTRGHTAKINKPRCHLDLRRSFFSYREIHRWNDLPQSVIDSGTINTFKNGLNKLRKNRVGFFMDQPVRLAQWTHQRRRTPKSRCGQVCHIVCLVCHPCIAAAFLFNQSRLDRIDVVFRSDFLSLFRPLTTTD